jgi:hypothetical protein
VLGLDERAFREQMKTHHVPSRKASRKVPRAKSLGT